MQRQRSFSVKPTGLLFSFAISSSLLIIISIWALSSPSAQDAHLRFSSSFVVAGAKSSGETQLSESSQANDSATWGNDSSTAAAYNGGEIFLEVSREEDDDDVSRQVGNDSVSAENKVNGDSGASCDLHKGKWVFDDSYPLYTNRSCAFIDEGFNCEANGRPDNHYMKWRWEPQGCNLPRFDASKMLRAIRGKRLVFVGDSINRNQWESLLCLLSSGLDPNRVYEARGRKITKDKGNYNIKFVDYKCSVEFYVTHFLVRESRARIGQKRKPTLRLDHVDRGSSKWRGADFLVFNSAHWWSHQKTRAGINYFQEGDTVHAHLDAAAAFRKALLTWAAWIDKNVDPVKTKVFFRTSSPSHFRGGEWNSGGHCGELTTPIGGAPPALGAAAALMKAIVEDVVGKMKTPVTLLDITSLSGLRIDGHPSIYGGRRRGGAAAAVQDCSHWCLPGVPDTWNELLYFHVASRRQTTAAIS